MDRKSKATSARTQAQGSSSARFVEPLLSAHRSRRRGWLATVVAQAAAFSKLGLSSQVVLVNGNIGVVSRLTDGRLLSVIGFTIAGGKVVEMDILADPNRLSRLDLSAIEP